MANYPRGNNLETGTPALNFMNNQNDVIQQGIRIFDFLELLIVHYSNNILKFQLASSIITFSLHYKQPSSVSPVSNYRDYSAVTAPSSY